MYRLIACLLILITTCLVPGCGGASGIQEGIPENVQPPADFDPGGSSKPDMSGKHVAPKK